MTMHLPVRSLHPLRPPLVRFLALVPIGRAAVAAAWALALAGCATPFGQAPGAAPAGASSPSVASPAAAAPAGAAARPDPAAPRPFAEVAAGATRSDGFVPVWRKDEKVWLEIAPERLRQPMLVSINIAQSVGERGLYASQMGPRWMAEFRRIGNQMQLVARQTRFRGERDPAMRTVVGQSFSESLIGSAAVASAAHPERKSVLVDASFLLGDMAGYSTRLEAAFRMAFAPDRANSYFESVRVEPGLTTLAGRVHFAVPRLAAPPLVAPGGTPPPQTSPPEATADPRSLFVGFVYNFRELPAQPMRARRADARVGHFTESFTDLSDDLSPTGRVHHVRRWRLEKKEAAAALSEPVRPITFWLDRNVPARYRDVVTAAILEWNKAFERIGFKDAIVVRQQPDDAAFDTLDAGHASVRWFVGADVGFAIGPSHSDPRSGEILDADIGMSDAFGRGARRLASEDLGASFVAPAARPGFAGVAGAAGVAAAGLGAGELPCTYAAEAAQELGFALDLLAARGDLDPASPEAEAFARAYVREAIMHEVGHALGLRHNFIASTTVTGAQLRDEAYARTHGISGSVMDYLPFNLPLSGEARGLPIMGTLGPYDFWAIEYAYKPIAPEREADELKAIAERSRSEPALAFADDLDAGFDVASVPGLDPRINRFDAGDDPLAYATRRMALTKELWQRVQQRGVLPDDDALRLRRSMLEGLRQAARVPAMAAKYVGGMYIERDVQGTGKPGFRPVEPERQRQALQWLSKEVFAVDAFRFRPEFLASLTPEYIESNRAPLSVPQMVAQLQNGVLDRLLDAGTARRLLELPLYLTDGERAGAITLAEVYASVQGAVWSELKSAPAIDPMRRTLQREHLRRVQALLTRGGGAMPADALSLVRWHAGALQRELRAALARRGWSLQDRAHLEDAQAALAEALRATMQRF